MSVCAAARRVTLEVTDQGKGFVPELAAGRPRPAVAAGAGRRGRCLAGDPFRAGAGHHGPGGHAGGPRPGTGARGERIRAGKITVLIADDHPVVRQGLRVLLSLHADIDVVGEASDGAEAVELAAAVAPDVILLDLKLPGLDGLGVLAELRDRNLPARVLVLTSVADSASVTVAMRAGAAGFLYKDVDPDALVRAVRSVHDGHTVLAPEAAATLVRSRSRPAAVSGLDALTAREREVLAQIAEGRSNREIARLLHMSEKTVKTHVSSVLAKLGVADRTQAALHAVRNSPA